MTSGTCRACGAALEHTFVDLGVSPLANSYLREQDLEKMEPFYPLHAWVCGTCFLVQLKAFETPERIFSDYAYFSSYSETWLAHARQYVEAVIQRFALDSSHHVVEVASNDGYLLRNFVSRGVPVLGIEPARNVAEAAQAAGVPTVARFFGAETARAMLAEHKGADLLIGNNVLAHVPDLNDFVEGLRILLKPRGVITLEFPYLFRLIEGNQFDTIYHEHFSYFSLHAVERVFEAHGLVAFDLEMLTTHGGSLRVFAQHRETGPHPVAARLDALRKTERNAGVTRLETYQHFARGVHEAKCALLEFLIQQKRAGRSVVGYGAPAKGNTLLNYCGVRSDLLAYTVDRSPHKQGRYLPGSRIPIHHPDVLQRKRPDFVLILPWNIADEIAASIAFVREYGGRFATPIPRLRVLD